MCRFRPGILTAICYPLESHHVHQKFSAGPAWGGHRYGEADSRLYTSHGGRYLFYGYFIGCMILTLDNTACKNTICGNPRSGYHVLCSCILRRRISEINNRLRLRFICPRPSRRLLPLTASAFVLINALLRAIYKLSTRMDNLYCIAVPAEV